VCFFFSSRRRHTRFSRDWSSDVCSSDLEATGGLLVLRGLGLPRVTEELAERPVLVAACGGLGAEALRLAAGRGGAGAVRPGALRSEERRVGEEWRSRRSRRQYEQRPIVG